MTAFWGSIYLSVDSDLADAIALKPVVKRLCSQYQKVFWPSPVESCQSIRNLFQDLTNLHVVTWISQEWEQNWIQSQSIAVVDLKSIPQLTRQWLAQNSTSHLVSINKHRQIYEYFDIPFSERYRSWKAAGNWNRQQWLDHINSSHEPFVLYDSKLADNNGRPLQQWRLDQGLPDIKMFEFIAGDDLLDWTSAILQAQELHVCYGALWALADSLHDQTAAQWFFHDNDINNWVQVNCMSNQHRWHVVNYSLRS